MAFGWFRRRQKFVIGMMVLLMVTFLLSASNQIMDLFVSRDPSKQAIGKWSGGKVILRDRQVAAADLELLRDLMAQRNPQQPYADPLLQFLLENRGQEDTAYMLLLKEADKYGVSTTRLDVSEFLKEFRLDGATWDAVLNSLRSGSRYVSDDRMHDAVARWVTIRKLFTMEMATTPPSEAEVKQMYRDFNERIKLRVIQIHAEDFLKEVPTPTDQEIQKQFDAFKNVAKGSLGDVEANSFGFGYKVPDQVSIQYLAVDAAAVARAAKPTEDQIIAYFVANKARFTKPGDAKVDESKLLEEARPKILAELTASSTGKNRSRDLVEVITSKAEELKPEQILKADPNGNPFSAVVKQMTLSADEYLKKPVKSSIENLTLEDAMGILAADAGLDAICYPYSVPGREDISPQIRVTVKPVSGTTLGAALADITAQVRGPLASSQPAGKPASAPSQPKIPDLKWARCVGLEKVLFPVEGIVLFPVQAGQTALTDVNSLLSNEILGTCITQTDAAGQRLLQLAFTCSKFGAAPQQGQQMSVGDFGPKMFMMNGMSGEISGRVLWRLADASPTHAPLNVDVVAGLKQQVADDVKIQVAFGKALKVAQDIYNAPRAAIANASKIPGVKVFETDFFARKMRNPYGGWRSMPGMIRGLDLSMYSPRFTEQVIEMAFRLAPAKVEPPFEKESAELALLPLQPKHQIDLLQRVDFEPVIESEYRQTGRGRIINELMYFRQAASVQMFFNFSQIAARVDYKPERGE